LKRMRSRREEESAAVASLGADMERRVESPITKVQVRPREKGYLVIKVVKKGGKGGKESQIPSCVETGK
jgi:hypothetical protein